MSMDYALSQWEGRKEGRHLTALDRSPHPRSPQTQSPSGSPRDCSSTAHPLHRKERWAFLPTIVTISQHQ
ncbi:hypothetical protein DFA_09605 [Cavenderia fasciculata]|uniref:Uncharacterized protein n=1 Tax=Cavenderia fasciculata TaxID=261658 RepID=F4Q834_CACFS|nr:uncharacterized protein DFA_09605 [Cavenderia fasciculata]EGG15934.1 hypothetical protein DFA_09605 [Cavenderia fasciculata]|eukprot:XP_004352259.1 hypothetical protein DFA_09605 [Cavenderia fasciculata]